MSVRIRLRAAAADDLRSIFDYLDQEASPAIALRFANAAQAALARLSEFPGMGSPKAFRNRKLRGIRSWPVSGFPNHLIFYRILEGAIDVIAVLHGARRLAALLRDRV